MVTLTQDLHQVVGQVPPSQIKTVDGVGKGMTLVDWYSVRHTVSGVHDNTSGTTRCVQGEHGLNGHVYCLEAERLEHDLGSRRKQYGCQYSPQIKL